MAMPARTEPATDLYVPRVRKVADVGRHAVVETMVGDTAIKAVVDHADVQQGAEVHLAFRADQTRLYRDGWIATEASQ